MRFLRTCASGSSRGTSQTLVNRAMTVLWLIRLPKVGFEAFESLLTHNSTVLGIFRQKSAWLVEIQRTAMTHVFRECGSVGDQKGIASFDHLLTSMKSEINFDSFFCFFAWSPAREPGDPDLYYTLSEMWFSSSYMLRKIIISWRLWLVDCQNLLQCPNLD